MRSFVISIVSVALTAASLAGESAALDTFRQTATAALQAGTHADLDTLFHTDGASPFQLDLSWQSILTNFHNRAADSSEDAFQFCSPDDPSLNPKAVASLSQPKTMNGHRYAPNLPVESICTFPGGTGVAIGPAPDGVYRIAMMASTQSPSRPVPDSATSSLPASTSQGARLARFKLDLWSALSEGDLRGLDSLLFTDGAPPDSVDVFVSLLESMLSTQRLKSIDVQPTASMVPDPAGPPNSIDTTELNGHRYTKNLPTSGICSVRAVSADGNSSGGITFRIGIDPQGNYRIPFPVRQPAPAAETSQPSPLPSPSPSVSKALNPPPRPLRPSVQNQSSAPHQ